MDQFVGKGLIQAAYGLFLFWYLYAAAAYGLTRDTTLTVFQWGMGGTFLLWLIGHALARTWPRTGLWPWILSAAVLAFGWAVALGALLDDWIASDSAPNGRFPSPSIGSRAGAATTRSSLSPP